MGSLMIQVLGTPEVRLGEQPLSFPTRKVLALLVYFAVERGMHSREALMALLWPESPSNRAAASLRATLSRLRQGLQSVGDILIAEGGSVGFAPNHSIDLDLDWLKTAVREESPTNFVRS